jgi:two-component system sensor kinase FixL
MARTRRSKAKSILMRLLRRVPLPVLAVLIGLGVGLAVWDFLDRTRRGAVRDLFREELQLRLDQRSRENLIRFDQYLENYAATTRLLANHRRLALYLDPVFWFEGEAPEPRRYEGFRPYWLPDLIGRNSLTAPSQVLLVDSKGLIREIYSAGEKQLPKELSSVIRDQFLDQSRVRSVLTRFDDQPYLIVADAAADAGGYGMGYLLLVVPIDERFLATSQQGVSHSDDLVAVIDADDQRILASSDPRTLLPGTQVEQWTGDYLVTSQSFTEYEGADWNVVFATFMSRAVVEAMSNQVRQLEKRQRLISALVFIAVFTLLIYLVSARLNRVLKRISRFSERALGFRPVHYRSNRSGNQLLLLEDQVYQFIRLVLEARTQMRRRHETEIRETEALKTAILEASLDPIVTIDGSGDIVEFNPTAEQAFGHRRGEVLGRNFTALFLTGDGAERFRDLLSECRKNQQDASHGFVRSELEAVHGNGTVVPVEISIVPILLESTFVYTVYLHDISSRREAERQIRSLAKFASESPSPVLRVDAQGVIRYANAASRPLLDYWGCRLGQTLPPLWYRRIARVLEQGRDAEREIELDGQVFSLLFAPVAELGYVNLYGRDVTAVRRAEQESRQHQAELVHVCRLSTMGEVATGMAHELNQPLSAIVNFANGCSRRIQSGVGDPPELVDALGQITGQAQRASEIIRRLRGMVGKQTAVREVVDMNHLVQEVCTFVEFDAGRQGVNIEMELAERALPVRVDLVQIEQVLLNLVRNALDALQEVPRGERRVLIHTQALGGEVRVEIRDSGPGIDAATLQHLFDAFFTTKETGMGMGLPISKTIVEEHSGKIWSSSRSGEGASFFVHLPGAWSDETASEKMQP